MSWAEHARRIGQDGRASLKRLAPAADVIPVGVSEDLPAIDVGAAGASAWRAYERRRGNRHTWLHGAGGEEQVAKRLTKHLGESAVLLHDRRLPRSMANIDHIAVAPSGIWVIDAKRYTGKVAISKPPLGEAMLMIAGRNRSRLADGLALQVAAVRSVMGERADIPVHGAFCFVDADLPTIGTLTFRGYPLLSPRRLAGRIKTRERGDAELLQAVAMHLSIGFPAA